MNACLLIIVFKYALLSSGENFFRGLRKLKIVLFEVYYHDMHELSECMVDYLSIESYNNFKFV